MLFNRNHVTSKLLANLLSFSIITSNVAILPTAYAAPTQAPSDQAAAPQEVRLLVKMRPGVRALDTARAISNGGGLLHRSIGALRTHVVRVRADRVDAAINSLRHNPNVFSIERDHGRKISSAPNDTAYSFQWALPKIGWDQVFGVVSIAGSATIAVLDTGVQASDATLVPGWSAFGTDPTQDLHGHGSLVASIAAATTDNSFGIAGIGFSGVSIMPVQVIAADGTGQDSDIIAGLTWAADNGANVVIMAFSDPGYSQALQDAVDYATRKGVVLVAAAGNDSSTSPTYPAGDVNVLGVGATDQNDEMWSGSNISPAVFITAPGVEIAAESASGSVTSVTGTSAAAAIVGGAAALLKAFDQGATPGMIIGRLARNADAGGMANGRINLARAIADTSIAEVIPNGAAGGGPIVGPYTVAANRKITVTLGGIQQGVVTSSPSGINCGSSCVSNFNTTSSVTLTATPFTGATFTGWSGACTGTSPTCTVSASSANQSVTANFGGQYQSTTTVTCPSSVVYTASLRTPCTAAWSSPQPGGGGTLTPTYASNLNAGTAATASASFSGNALNTPSSGTKNFQITKAPLTVTFTIVPKVYNGTATAVINGCTLSGVLGSDNVGCVVSGASATLSTAVVGSATATGTGFTLSGSSAANYNIVTINTLSTTIAPKPLTVSFTAANKAYDGTTAAVISNPSLSGVVSGDNVNVNSGSGTGSFSDPNIGVGKTVTASTSIFNLTGPHSSNYIVVTVNSTTASIAAVSLTVNFTADNKTYDGTTSATISDCTLSGRISGDTTTTCNTSGASATFADKNAAPDKTVTGNGFGLSGPNASNYIISNTSPTTTATIGQKSLSVSASGANKTYDGNTTATVTFLDDRIEGDVFTVNYAASFLDANVGIGKPVNVTGISLSGTDAGNYTPNTTASTTADITKAALIATIVAANKTYDGTTAALITYCNLAGIVSGDTVTCFNESSNFSDEDVGTDKEILASVSLSGASAGNYSVNETALTTANIDAISLVVTADDQARLYGSANPTFTTTISGFINGEVLVTSDVQGTALCTTSATVTSSVSDAPYTITCTAGSLTSANYTFTFADGNLQVSPAPLSITPDADINTLTIDHFFRTYGQPNATSYTVRYNGFVNSEDPSALQGVLSFSTLAVPTSPVGLYDVNASGLSSSNYAITYLPGALEVTQATLKVDAAAKTKTYGDADPAFTWTYSGYMNGETSVNTTGSADCTRLAGEAASAYAITCAPGNLDATNYKFITGESAPLTIGRAVLSVNAVDASKTYGDIDPTFTWTYSGYVNGDNELSAGISGNADCTRASGETVVGSPYSITCAPGALASANYSFTTGSLAKLAINPATLIVTADDQTRLYGSANPSLTTTISGFVNSEILNTSDVQGTASCTTIATATSSVSGAPYTITCTAGSLTSANYTFTFADGKLHVNPAPLSITPDADINTTAVDHFFRTYGQPNATSYTVRYNGFVNSEDPSALQGVLSFSTLAVPTSAVGLYDINAGGLSSTNYAITYLPGALEVSQATLKVDATAQSKTYGDADPAFTWTYLGYMNGETSVSTTGSASCTRLAGEAASAYAITCAPGNLDATNYKFVTGESAPLTIEQAVLSVNAVDASKTYGDIDPTFTWTYSGFVNGDNELSTGISGNAGCTRASGETVVGSPYSITCAPGALTSANYSFATGDSAKLEINPAILTVTADDQTRLYGSANPSLTTTISGFANSEVLNTSDVQGTASCTTTATLLSAVASGPYTITCTAGSLTSANYTFTFADGNLQVNPAPLSITPDADVNTTDVDHFFRTYGQPNPTSYTVRYNGFVNSEDPSALEGVLSFSTLAVPTSAVGLYDINAGGLSSTNYAITYLPGSLEVTQATLKVDAAAKTKTYGDADPAFTWTYSGYMNGETSVSTTGSADCTRLSGESASAYAITCAPGNLATTNYKFVTGESAPLTIEQAILLIDTDAKSKVYGQSDPVFTWTYSGYVSTDTAASVALTINGSASCTRAPGQSVGTYAISCAADTLASPNYKFATGVSALLDITKATLMVNKTNTLVNEANTLMVNEANNLSKIYGQADPAFTWNLSGFVYSENMSTAGVSGSAACSRDVGEDVGQYLIRCGAGTLSATNYSFAEGASAMLTIDKATLLVNAVATSKNVGAADLAFTSTYTGFIGTNNSTNSSITGAASCSRNPGETWGGNPYTITCNPGSLLAPNYAFATGSTAAFTINDVVGPTITLNAPTNGAVYALNQSVLANYTCQDETNGSGMNSCVGTTPNGAAISTSSVGPKTYTVTAKDNAGNTTIVTRNYIVQYVLTGFEQPVSMTAVNVANSGRAIPLKFTVKDSAGNGVTSLPLFAIYQATYQCGNTSNLLTQDLSVYATGASGLQNLGGGNWQFNWNTNKNYKGSCRQIQLNVGDGVIHIADFQFN